MIYTDSDYSGSLIDRRSTTGYCTMLGGNLVTRRNKNTGGIDEVLWIQSILKDLQIAYEKANENAM